MSLIERAAERLREEQRQQAALAPQGVADAAAGDAEVDTSAEPLAAGTATGLASDAIAASPDAARRESTVVHVSEEHLRTRGCLVPSDTTSALAHEYRRAKRPLLFNVKAAVQANGHPDGQNLILVTSALPGEGKSFAAVNMALSIASEIDQTVLLIDCDVARRGAASTLGTEQTRGMLDVAAGDCGVEDVLLHTDIPSLTFIPAGTSRPNADELYASDAMRDLIAEIGTRYADRIIIIDAPPALATNIPSILVKMVGQVLFVVEADRTPQHFVMEALQTLDGCENIGLLLNKASRRLPGQSYGYGYGYGYGPT